MTGSEKITVEVLVDAGLDKAWLCFVDPAFIVRWNFASPEWCCPKADNDLRPGGTFSYRMEARDGSFGFDFGGTYTRVVDKQILAYKLGDEREVTVEFKAEGSRTRVTETFDPEHQNSLELQKNGWQAILDNYKKVAETLA